MASVFKRKRTIKGVAKVARKWTVQWADADGNVCRQTGYTDKSRSMVLALRLESEARAGVQVQHQRTPLAEHLDAYEAYLKAQNDSPAHVFQTKNRISRILAGCTFQTIGDVDQTKLEMWLANQRATQKWFSIRTSNYYGRDFKSFLRWLVESGRMENNPLRRLRPLNAETDDSLERRALSEDEFALLVAAADEGPEFRKISGPDRAMLYLVAANTGLRASGLASLTTVSLLDSGVVQVRAGHSKRRRNDRQPLRADLLALLTEWARGREGRLWPGTWHKKAAKMLRRDLAAARAAWIKQAESAPEAKRREQSDFLSERNKQGQVFDFHALRHQFISNLARSGVPAKVAQELARHSTITLTLDRYSHLLGSDVSDALKQLPALRLPDKWTQKWTQAPVVSRPDGACAGTVTEDRQATEVAAKALRDNDLASIDAVSHVWEEVRLLGLEPKTYGLKGKPREIANRLPVIRYKKMRKIRPPWRSINSISLRRP